MTYRVTKTYGHNLGFSACFRQWRASSHCRFLHGYALQVELVFEAATLNQNNWVIDFGGLQPIKQLLEILFDHKTLVAADDPLLEDFRELNRKGIIDLVEVDATGCEAFAKMVATQALSILQDQAEAGMLRGGAQNDPRLVSVEVREHGANSATYFLPHGRIAM